jgi:hypothetical protein
MGTSPLAPYVVVVYVPVELGRMYQTYVEGRQNARSVFPSPSKSAWAGTSPLAPKLVEEYDPSLDFVIHQAPLRNIAKSVFPSPS